MAKRVGQSKAEELMAGKFGKVRPYGPYSCDECKEVTTQDSGHPTCNRWCSPCWKITKHFQA